MATPKKPEITYPCSWQYKLIAHEQVAIEQAVKTIVADQKHTLSNSKQSSSGKYISMNIELTVTSERHRDSIFTQFREHIDIKFVI